MEKIKLYVVDGTGTRFNYYEIQSWNTWLWSKIENAFEDEQGPITINVL